jgi:hypothetical protein
MAAFDGVTFDDLSQVERWLDRFEQRSPGPPSAGDGRAGFSAGPALMHCAQSLDYQRTGFPAMKPTIVRRTIGPLVARLFLRRGRMKHSLDAPIPGAPVIDDADVATGIAELRRAIGEFRATTGPLAEHFVYGRLDRARAERLQAFHIANHASVIDAVAA